MATAGVKIGLSMNWIRILCVNNISLFGLNTLCRQISEILTTFTFRFPNRIPFPFYNQLHNYIWQRVLLVEVFPLAAEPQQQERRWLVEGGIYCQMKTTNPSVCRNKSHHNGTLLFCKGDGGAKDNVAGGFPLPKLHSIPLTIHTLSPTPPFFGLYISGDEILASEKRMSLICRRNHEVEVI